MPRYKHGKQITPIGFQTFQEAMQNGEFKFPKRDRSLLALLYWCGIRKSEAYERTKEDFTKTDTHLIIDFGKRKKGGLDVPPLELRLELPYVDLIVERVEKARKGRRVWNISGTTAWRIVKRALGEKYYPHFLRLNRATHFLDDPETTVPDMKAWFGWKSSQTIDSYIGYSKRNIRRQSERLEKELKQT